MINLYLLRTSLIWTFKVGLFQPRDLRISLTRGKHVSNMSCGS
jgi:hypothetical protein